MTNKKLSGVSDLSKVEKNSRRTFLEQSLSLTASAGLSSLMFGSTSSLAQPSTFTQWGWPTPYRKISDKSVSWLSLKVGGLFKLHGTLFGQRGTLFFF
jgi:hypothetical protein